jgi:GMP synthase (glutamine-hydrolysing)
MTPRQPTALALSHLPFEDLGTLEAELERRGFDIQTVDVATAQFPLPQTMSCDLLVVLGGPIGVYDAADYPFLTAEIDCIKQRLEAQKPVLGICLGAQLMAAALGAKVYPGSRGAEIAWFPLLPAEPSPEWFMPLLAEGLKLFHWHGDTFDLPVGGHRLAATELYENQAFSFGDFALGLQFHPEVTAIGLERWYVGHASELNQKGISIRQLRAAAQEHAPALLEAAAVFWKLWLDYIL